MRVTRDIGHKQRALILVVIDCEIRVRLGDFKPFVKHVIFIPFGFEGFRVYVGNK